jgi:hypothetical protein
MGQPALALKREFRAVLEGRVVRLQDLNPDSGQDLDEDVIARELPFGASSL